MFLLHSVKKDLGRMRRDPVGLATSLGIPLVLVTLITLVFGGGGEAAPQGRLLVADQDGSQLSHLLAGVFSRGPLGKMLVIENTERENGLRRMDRGEASALLIIPSGFQRDWLENKPVQLRLVTNPAQEILPRIIEETLSIAVDGGFYLQRQAGPELRVLASNAQSSIVFNRLVQSFGKYLNPPLIDLDFHVAAEKQEKPNIAALFLPSMVFMGLLFVANAYALDIWKEYGWGTLRRLATTPASLGAFLGARLISFAVILSAVALIGVAGMRWVAHVPVASVPMATLWVVLSGTAFYLFLVTIALHAPNQRSANVIGNMVVFPLSLIGGSFFPFEMMPGWMASIGRWTPNGWAITAFKGLITGAIHVKDFLAGAACIAAVGTILFFLILSRIRRLA